MAPPDDGPAGVATAAQTLQLIGRCDMLVGDEPLIRILVTCAFLTRDAGSRAIVSAAPPILAGFRTAGCLLMARAPSFPESHAMRTAKGAILFDRKVVSLDDPGYGKDCECGRH